MSRDVTTEAAKATPSLGAIAIGWFDVPLSQWSLRLGLIFILLQIAHLMWRWWRDFQERK